MVMGIKPGPISYANKMTPAEWNDYDAKLALIESMEVSGELVRGWKTKVVAQIPYTFAMVSGVLSRRIISPPVLDMIILRIGARGRSRANFDYHERIEQLQATQLQVGELIDQQQAKLTEAAEQYEERVRALAAAHQRDMDKLTTHHEILQGRYAELATEIENLQMEVEAKYGEGDAE